jgi:hypothetical protein
MSNKHDPYASEEESLAVLQKDTRTNAEKRLDQLLEERWANEQGLELESKYNVLRQIALELLEQRKPPRFSKESKQFKEWYDEWWLGDGQQGEIIPGSTDADFPKYLDGYTLAFGAWMAAKHAAHELKG